LDYEPEKIESNNIYQMLFNQQPQTMSQSMAIGFLIENKHIQLNGYFQKIKPQLL
jgi:hypothetical protein